MTDPVNDDFENGPEDLPVEDELTALKKRADIMGIKYSPNIGVETLRGRINEKLNDGVEKPAAQPAGTAGETPQQMRMRLRKDALRLVRVRLTCMDPNKKEWPGEIFTVANGVVGTVKRYVPYNLDSDDGWHVEAIILKQLKTKKHQEFRKVKLDGKTVTKGFLVRTFAIEELPPLTGEQLKDLAQRQAMNHSIDNA